MCRTFLVAIEKNQESLRDLLSDSTPLRIVSHQESPRTWMGTQQDLNLPHHFHLRSVLTGHRLRCKRCEELKPDYHTLSGILGGDEKD